MLGDSAQWRRRSSSLEMQLLLTEMSAQLLQMQNVNGEVVVGRLALRRTQNGEGAILRKKGRLLQVL